MKKTFTLFVCGFLSLVGRAQWSDTANRFTDSLHMQVTSAPYNQGASVIVRSYPDSGYFVIWQDSRNDPSNTKTAIYAQKYSKTGTALWAVNGVPVAASTNRQHYTYGSQGYRNRSYAATDSAGGFYIAYADDSVTNYVYQRACIQHIKSNGTAVFGGPGAIISSSTAANLDISPQLVADGYSGFFYSFIGADPGTGVPVNVYIYCYKDVNGTLQNYGGGTMNQNAVQVTATSACGVYTYLNYTAAEVKDYNIFGDRQGGCNVVMYLNVNGPGLKIGYNKLWRAKKTSTSTEYSLDDKYNPVSYQETYLQGNVYRLYYLKTDHQTISCGDGSGGIAVVTQYRLVQNGFQEVDGGSSAYDFNDPKGVTVTTAGNINASLLAAWKRTYAQSTGVSNPVIAGYVVKEEIYDSIPYQRASNNNPNYPGYNTTEPASLNKLNFFRDTILAAPVGYDFSLTGGSNQIFSSAVTINTAVTDFTSDVRLQHLAIERQSVDSFAVIYKTFHKTGEVIGKDNTDFRNGTEFDLPYVQVDNNGVGLFSVKDNITVPGSGASSPRVSPIFTGAQLAWGAMGKPIGIGILNGTGYSMSSPFVSLDPLNGTALMTWTDGRNNATTGYDIYMRHLDDLNNPDYKPPYKRVMGMPNAVATSAVLYGTTNALTSIDASSSVGISPVVAISDNYNLGTVNVSVYDNTGNIRTTSDGKPYLDRSFTITPQNNPNGAATITVRLFFTTAQFTALQAADPSIKTPGDLEVIKQPSGSGSGSTYSVVAGQQTVIPQTWAAVDGGYYIEIQITGFSNFFIFKNPNAPLPVTWLGVTAQRLDVNTAVVTWNVASETNVKDYTVKYSVDGITYKDGCTVSAAGISSYHCTMPISGDNRYFVYVEETDVDGLHVNSQTVLIDKLLQPMKFVVSPNPAHTDAMLIYNVPGTMKASLRLVTDAGVAVWQEATTLSASGSVQIPLGRLPAGVYNLQVILPEETMVMKVVKE